MKITSINPWLIKAEGTYWGEYFFVEVTTDEGVTGWGEITTTTQMANRTIAGMIRQLNDLLVGGDPVQIERIWHKIFRTFTYMGSRGATCQAISGIDIALWDIRAIIDSGHTALKFDPFPILRKQTKTTMVISTEV
jgi:galactonate dehydratase